MHSFGGEILSAYSGKNMGLSKIQLKPSFLGALSAFGDSFYSTAELTAKQAASHGTNRKKIESNLSAPGIQEHHENALIKSLEISPSLIYL